MDAFLAVSNGEVILIVAFVAMPLAAIAFAGSGHVYEQIGKGLFEIDHDPPLEPGQGDGVSRQVREAELRQMLEAKSYRRAQRGEEPLDVEAELARLLRPAPPAGADPGLAAEVRDLVIARNHRRMAKGQEPLDVESEVARRLADLEGLGQ